MSLNFVTYGDIQYYTNPSKSYTRPDGMNSWLWEQIQVTHQIFSYAKDNNINLVIFNGDLFEIKNRIDFDTLNIVWSLYREYSKSFDIIMNTGNHDFYSLDRRKSSLLPFSDNVRVVCEPEDLKYDSTLIRIIPYGMVEGNLSIPKGFNKTILFTHEDIAGLKLGPSDYTSGAKLKSQIFGSWDIVFNSHIHKPQTLGNIVNIGSPMAQDFGEIDDVKRFIHYKDGEVISVPTACPRFFTFSGLNDKIKKTIMGDSRNFYRIDVDSRLLSDPVFKKFNVSVGEIKVKEREVRLKKNLRKGDELKEYIKISKPKLDYSRLLKVGEELAK